MESNSLERRLTKFPGSSSGQVLNPPEKAKTIGRSRPPAQLPIPVNSKSSQFLPIEERLQAKIACVKQSPWISHQPIYLVRGDDERSTVTIAHDHQENHGIFAIKKHLMCSGQSINRLSMFIRHDNLVNFDRIFLKDGHLFLRYELMDITLAEIQCTPSGRLLDHHIAAICNDVLHGTQYIHEQLKIAHGAINVHNVMVTRQGELKISNIGQSLLRASSSTDSKQQDIRALGLLMVRLMEIDTSLKTPDSLDLQNPELWKAETQEFLKRTGKSSIGELQKDIFLNMKPLTECLKPLVLIAEKSVQKEWEDVYMA